jgi:hypothetical protein
MPLAAARDRAWSSTEGLVDTGEGVEPNERKHILNAIGNTVPLANLMDGQIAALHQWAKGRAREAGASATNPPRPPRRRRIDPRAN